MAEVYPGDNTEVVKHEGTDTAQVTKRDYDYITGQLHVTVPPASGETVQTSKDNVMLCLFNLTRFIKKIQKQTNEELDETIKENEHVAEQIKEDDSKYAQKEKMEHDITKDEKKKRNAG